MPCKKNQKPKSIPNNQYRHARRQEGKKHERRLKQPYPHQIPVTLIPFLPCIPFHKRCAFYFFGPTAAVRAASRNLFPLAPFVSGVFLALKTSYAPAARAAGAIASILPAMPFSRLCPCFGVPFSFILFFRFLTPSGTGTLLLERQADKTPAARAALASSSNIAFLAGLPWGSADLGGGELERERESEPCLDLPFGWE